MRKIKQIITITLIMLFSMTGLFSQKTEIINGYKVARGERPAINLSKVSPDAYYPDKIWVKLSREMEDLMPDNRIYQSETKGLSLKTGITKIDQVNEKYRIEKIRPKQYGFYETSPASVKYRERHKAWGFHLWMEVYLPEGTDVIQVVKDYMSLEEVEFAEPVYLDKIHAPVSSTPYIPTETNENTPKLTVNDTRYSEQWHYNNTGQEGGTVGCDIDLPEAWDIERGNNQVLVAVQDMGIQLNHPDLGAHVWSGVGYDFQADNTSIEGGDHGCHTAGTISAISDNNTGVAGIAGGTGSADGVRLMSVQVYAPDGAGGGNSNLPYLYSADNDAVISQNSWGYTTVGYYDQLVLDGIDYFTANGGGTALNGGLVIFAAGNSNSSGLWWPGCYSNAMAVAATDYDDVRAYYSNYDTWVEIAAPGGYTAFADDPRGVLSCWASSNYGFYQGTSMACPHVSGVAALIISMGPGLFTNTQVRDILKNTTDNIDAENPSFIGELGTGRLNAYAALVEAQSLLGPPDAPTLASPLNSATVSNPKPMFDWNDAAGASTYDILVDNDSNFNFPEIDQSVSSSSYTPALNLSEGTYYWKVRSQNPLGTSAYSSTWSMTIAIPDINLTSSLISTYAAPDGTDNDSFSVENVGSGELNYNASFEYTGWPASKAVINAESNDFESGLGYTSSGTTWATGAGGTWNGSTTCAIVSAESGGSAIENSTLTSGTFDGTICETLTLAFDQNFYTSDGRSDGYVDYSSDGGSTWTQVWTNGATTTASVTDVSLPTVTDNMRIRFRVYLKKNSTAYWHIDNITVSGEEVITFSWLSIDGGETTSGTVSASGFDQITVGCDAAGLVEGLYTADITINSDDPDEPTKVLPVEFTVESSGAPPSAPGLVSPSNASTLYILKPVFDWNDVAGAETYTLLVDNNATFASPEIDESLAESTYTPVSDLAEGTYSWKVLSTNAFGSSSYSTTWTVIIAPLTAPINVTTSVAGTELTVSWDEVTGSTSYDVYSSDDPYDTFNFEANVSTNQYTVPYTDAKKFYYIVSKN